MDRAERFVAVRLRRCGVPVRVLRPPALPVLDLRDRLHAPTDPRAGIQEAPAPRRQTPRRTGGWAANTGQRDVKERAQNDG